MGQSASPNPSNSDGSDGIPISILVDDEDKSLAQYKELDEFKDFDFSNINEDVFFTVKEQIKANPELEQAFQAQKIWGTALLIASAHMWISQGAKMIKALEKSLENEKIHNKRIVKIVEAAHKLLEDEKYLNYPNSAKKADLAKNVFSTFEKTLPKTESINKSSILKLINKLKTTSFNMTIVLDKLVLGIKENIFKSYNPYNIASYTKGLSAYQTRLLENLVKESRMLHLSNKVLRITNSRYTVAFLKYATAIGSAAFYASLFVYSDPAEAATLDDWNNYIKNPIALDSLMRLSPLQFVQLYNSNPEVIRNFNKQFPQIKAQLETGIEQMNKSMKKELAIKEYKNKFYNPNTNSYMNYPSH